MRLKKSVGVALGLLAVGVAVLLLLTRPSGPWGAARTAREQAMEMLGARIAKLRPEPRVLVLSNPFTANSGYLDEKRRYERIAVRGLRKGLGKRSSVTVVFPELRAEYLANPQAVLIPPESTTPLSFLIQPGSVDQLADAHPDCNVIVSLIGLPVGVDRLKLWSEKDARCFGLLLPDLRLLGPPDKATDAFEREKILAAVVHDPTSQSPLIVTRENLAEVLQRQPHSLGY